MGSFGAGLASIGGVTARAEELARQQKLEDIRLELEKSKLGLEQARTETEKKYAGIAGEREQLERQKFEEAVRVARLPKFVGFRTVGGRLYYGLQSPIDGSIQTQEVTGVDAGRDADALEQSIE